MFVESGGRKSRLTLAKKLNIVMKKEIRQDVYTQAAYAKKIGKSRAWVNQQIKAGNIKTLRVNGATLIKE